MQWRMGFWKRQRERKMEGGAFFFFFVKFYDIGRAFLPAEEAMEWADGRCRRGFSCRQPGD